MTNDHHAAPAGPHTEATMRRNPWFPILATAALAGAGCSDSNGPGEVVKPPEELTILRLAATSPPVWNPEVTFWAYADRDGEARIWFENPEGNAGEEYLRFRVASGALLTYPDGTPFGPQDSVEITIRVVDPALLLFEFEPAGLRFSPAEPAELELEYAEADDDLDDDGDVDGEDEALEGEIYVWRQRSPGDPFERLVTLRFEDLDELEADIPGFSRFAIAY
jgi:hypothetical protein